MEFDRSNKYDLYYYGQVNTFEAIIYFVCDGTSTEDWWTTDQTVHFSNVIEYSKIWYFRINYIIILFNMFKIYCINIRAISSSVHRNNGAKLGLQMYTCIA